MTTRSKTALRVLDGKVNLLLGGAEALGGIEILAPQAIARDDGAKELGLYRRFAAIKSGDIVQPGIQLAAAFLALASSLVSVPSSLALIL